MKYPEYRLSMEAALPSPVHSWFRSELELRGIDSLVYTRYIIRLLQQDNEDFDGFDNEADIFSKSKTHLKRKGKKTEKRKLSVTEEEKKKFAAIKCLAAITDENAGIETLVEELSSRLKDCEIQASASPVVKLASSSSDSSEDSGTENQNSAQRYYAAFPSLHGQDSSPNTSPTAAPTVAVGTIWKNNPLVKQLINANSGDDSSSANEDAEIKKINRQTQVAVPKNRRSRKINSRNNRDIKDQRKLPSKAQQFKPTNASQKGKKEKEQSDLEKTDKMFDWPPGFAKLDPEILRKLGLFDDIYVNMRTDGHQRQNDDLCTRVESLLKGMLLPAPEKTYKELQDVDVGSPIEQRERIEKCPTQVLDQDLQVLSKKCQKESLAKPNEKSTRYHSDSDGSPFSRDESISPELQEQEIWYTQPIDVIFHSQDDDVVSSKLRLYKRNSYPSFSPDTDSAKDPASDSLPSPASSPVFERNRSFSIVSNGSDDIWEGSVLIPAWLTEEISADQTEDEAEVVFSLSASLKSSSPYPDMAEVGSCSSTTFGTAFTSNYSSHADLVQVQGAKQHHWSTNTDEEENSTPTPEDTKSIQGHQSPSEISLSVSLVDWGYLSQFMVESGWNSFTIDDSLNVTSQRRLSMTSLWHSQVLFDYMEPMYETYDVQCWQPLGNRENPLSQLWDVNMQKRSRISPWDKPNIFPDRQIWLAENCLVYHNSVKGLEVELEDNYNQNKNTLIPHISIDMFTEMAADYSVIVDNKDDEDELCLAYFDRSFSMGDVPSVWKKQSRKVPDPKLSKSFELVPSEHSAFNDVPKKLLHVQSEPNLVQFRQEFNEGSQSKPVSPREHLYLSPKTHFRPITPAYAPELCLSKSKQQVCHDLFGGLPSTKTPYQQYHTAEDGSDEESFVPKFKVKHYSKSIQTGDSFDNVERASPAECCDTMEWDAPEALTREMIKDVMGEKDDADYLITISDDLDTANTDSAYETDYGISALESEQDSGTKYSQSHKHCCYNNDYKVDPFHDVSDAATRGRDLGEAIDYSVESFVATYPHTQDWPNISHAPQSLSESDALWTGLEGSEYHSSCLPQAGELFPESVLYRTSHEKADDNVHYSGYEEDMYKWGSRIAWGGDFVADHLYSDEEAERYKNVWSTAGQDSFSVDIANYYPHSSHGLQGEKDGGGSSDSVYCGSSSELFFPEGEQCYGTIDEFMQPDNGDAILDCSEKLNIELYAAHEAHEAMADMIFPVDEGIYNMSVPADKCGETVDYHSVKLVCRGKRMPIKPQNGQEQQSPQKPYGAYDLMPMPDEALLSSDLEKEWMDPEVQSLRMQYKASNLQRKPCSFYLEGNCRRSDCKFAHDISNLTCRFWEEGGCFKGPLCPFLHGYPSEIPFTPEPRKPTFDVKDVFNLHTEEFPELSLSVKNGNSNNKRSKISKSQNILGNNKKEKGRKGGGGRRHSNKENQVEVRIVDNCSSSI